MTRVHLLTLAVCISAGTNMHTMVQKETVRPTPQNTVYLFDYHDVIAPIEKRMAVEYARKNFRVGYLGKFTARLLRYAGYKIAHKFCTVNHRMLSFDYAQFNNETDEAYILWALHIMNCHRINQATLAFAQQCKDDGSFIYLFSNIGQRSFDFMNQQYDMGTLFNGKYICTEDNDFVVKKSPEAFKKLLLNTVLPQYQQKHGAGAAPAHIVMIDDDAKKIAIAQQGLDALKSTHPELQNTQFIPVQFKNSTQMQTIIQAELSR